MRRPPLVYLLPFFAAFGLFWAAPLVNGALLSLRAGSVFGPGGFVGLANYAAAFGRPAFWKALGNTAVYLAGTLLTIVPLALGAALLLRAAFSRARPWLRVLWILPALTPPVVLGLLFVVVFSGRHGLLNAILLAPWGGPPLDWLRDPRLIRPALLLLGVWRWTGLAALFLWAGLEGVPKMYEEAAVAEGAGALQRLRWVTLPLLRPVILFVCLFLAFDAVVQFSGSYVLLGGSGGPQDAGLLLVSLIYRTAFTEGKFAVAAAMSYAAAPLLAVAVWAFARMREFRDA